MDPEAQKRRDQELEDALEKMDEALTRANGTCSMKIKRGRRTIKVRRSLKELAEDS